jgi:hypothetical protein
MATISEEEVSEYKTKIVCSSIHSWIIKYICGFIGDKVFEYIDGIKYDVEEMKKTTYWRNLLGDLIKVRYREEGEWNCSDNKILFDLKFYKWRTEQYGRNRLPLKFDRFCRIFDMTIDFVNRLVEEEETISGINKLVSEYPIQNIIASMVLLYPIYEKSNDNNTDIAFSILQEIIDIEIHKYLDENIIGKEIDEVMGSNMYRQEIILKEQELKKKTDEEKKKAFEIKKKLKNGVCLIDMSNVEIEKPT